MPTQARGILGLSRAIFPVSGALLWSRPLSSSSPIAASAPEAVSDARAVAAPFSVTLLLFVISGATGLVDQLCFSKYLTYVVGSTAYAVSAVLAAFMTGLALGSHLGGRYTRHVRRPFFAYGLMEIVVGVAVALSPLAFGLLTPLYVELARSAPHSLALVSLFRWLMAMLLVIVPTTAMGATLPLLSRHLGPGQARDADEARLRERRIGWLYAVNTLGGAAGALGAAYLILPALGIAGTLHASAGFSLAIGLAAVVLGRREVSFPPERDASVSTAEAHEAHEHQTDRAPAGDRKLDEPPTRELVLLGVLAAGSGWLVFASEVVFTHLLALVIGNSAYAFGLILAVFLLCLFFGASRAAWAHRRFGDAALPLGLAAAGLALAATLPIWDKLPWFFANTGKVLQTFDAREAMRALAAFTVLVLPVTLMGLTFPLLLQRVARYSEVGGFVGRLTAINTLGAVVGSLVTGYLVLPLLGSQSSLIAIALVFVVGGLATPPALGRRIGRPVAILSAAGVAAALLLPRWNLVRLTSGTNVYFDGGQSAGKLLFLKEDIHGGVTSVTRAKGVTALFTNGKFQGNTGWEMSAQRSFAHYPSLFVHDYHHALVIGCGTGTTLGTLSAYPWKRLDLVEISPAIVEAARKYFTVPNRGALEDPRVHIHHQDGRNYLLVDQQRYDLISMELSSIWFAGAASLYDREYYQLVHAHLEPGGIFQQWVQLHHVHRRTFATMLNTLRREFKHVTLFYSGGQGILVASDDPLHTSPEKLAHLSERPAIQATLPAGRPLMSLVDDALVMDHGLDRFLSESADLAGVPLDQLVSTDDNLYLEYATPRGNVLPWIHREQLVAKIKRFRDQAAINRMKSL